MSRTKTEGKEKKQKRRPVPAVEEGRNGGSLKVGHNLRNEVCKYCGIQPCAEAELLDYSTRWGNDDITKDAQ